MTKHYAFLESRLGANVALQIGNLGSGIPKPLIYIVLASTFNELCLHVEILHNNARLEQLRNKNKNFFIDRTQNMLCKEKLMVGEVNHGAYVKNWKVSTITDDNIIIPIILKMNYNVVKVKGDTIRCPG